MFDENYVLIQGRLTADPTFTVGKSGKEICRFSIANNVAADKVHYLDCVAFEGTAKMVQANIKKGNPVFIKGRITSSSYTDEATGKKLKSVNVMVSTIWKIDRFEKPKENPFDGEIPV